MCAKEKRRWNVQQRDALGIVVLALLVVIIRMLFAPAPVVLPAPADFAPEQRTWERRGGQEEGNRESEGSAPFAFDPNTLDSAGFRRLGFSSGQTASLLRYRNSGAVFRKPEDFSRAYVVSEQMYQRLLPYIRIEPTPRTASASPSASPPTNPPLTNPPLANPLPATPPQPSSPLPSPPANLPPPTPPQRTSSRWELIEINGADTSRLQRLRGIGPYYAQRIVHYRERLGGFVAVEQLLEVEGMDEERFALFALQVDIDHSLVRKMDMRHADQSTLGKHPYIGPYAARWIVHYREQLGDTVCTLPSLLRRNIINTRQAQWLEYYLE